MKTVYVQFEDDSYNYTTNANGPKKDIEKYFVNQWLNMGHLLDDMQRCIKVTIT